MFSKRPKHVPKRKSNTQNKDEFFVLSKQVDLISPFQEKIERMYQVKMGFEENEVENGRWLVLEGESVDRRNAKNYIKALSDPAELKQIQFPASVCTVGAQFTDPEFLEKIEKQTNAVIKPMKEIAKFEINGTELAVTLAMSQMEELAESILQKALEDDNNVVDESCESNRNNSSSSRLSHVLERALSEHSDGLSSVNDYLHAPASIQRVLVNCLQESEDVDDIDDDLLFGDEDGGDDKKVSVTAGRQDNIDVDGVVGVTDTNKKSPGMTALTHKMTETSITSKPGSSSLITKQIEYLRSFGSSVGYDRAEVEKALEHVDEKTRPSDFLDLLSSVKSDFSNTGGKSEGTNKAILIKSDDSDDDVIILETETIDLTNDLDESSKGHSPQGKQCDSDTKTLGSAKNVNNSQLPENYQERLMMDFFQEDDNCSVEDLKKRNAERQKLLKKMMSEEKLSQPSTKPNNSHQSETKTSGKKKKKTKKQGQQAQNQVTDNKEKAFEVHHDKQFRLDSDGRTFSSDGEQTCVLRVYNSTDTKQGGISLDPDTTSTTPKRKQSQHGDQCSNYRWSHSNSQDQSQGNAQVRNMDGMVQAYPGGPSFQQPNLGEPKGSEGQWQTVGRATQQSYTPRPLPPLPNGDHLRYIVIDGSNVAMTHGNGKHFSCKGLRICVDYFKQRGHRKITVFVPQWRSCRPSDDNPIIDQNILHELKEEDILVFTPSRRIRRKLVASYDDRFVLELAEAEDGVIVSNDQYRDLMREKFSWRQIIEERLLMFSFVRDRFMPPKDPLGQFGPCLDDFLQRLPPQPANTGFDGPYTRNYPGSQPTGPGPRPKFPPYNPNQGQQNQQFNQKQNQPPLPFNPNLGQQHQNKVGGQGTQERYQQQGQGQNFRTPVQNQFYNLADCMDGRQQGSSGQAGTGGHGGQSKGAWGKGQHKGQSQGQFGAKGHGHNTVLSQRSEKDTQDLYAELRTIFPEPHQDDTVRNVLENHDRERDLTKLTNYCMSVLFQ